jgi:hypothetical protein
MTTPSDDRTPADDEDGSAEAGSSRPNRAAGVELGRSDGAGGTFEPEEDVAPES